MRVLVVSHNVFSYNENMGKTLSSYFSEFTADELAQFYIHSQVPTMDMCLRYYRVTDKDALKSIFGVRVGHEFELREIETHRTNSRTDRGMTASIYQKARKRTPLIYFARNLWWKCAHWNNKDFKQWLDEFQPECVFLASGDYAFIYDIALKIACTRKIPLYVSCMDDYYFYNKNDDSVLGRLQHSLFMKSVNRTMSYASKIFCICDKMSDDYGTYFHKPCVTIHTPATIKEPIKCEKIPKISYLGNLGYSRDKQLIVIGRALRKLGLSPNHIDVYSAETRPIILKDMNTENGIVFHGAVGADEVLKIMGESLAVIHTESFDEKIRRRVRYSVSTKIADSVASGTSILAYGPEEIASISYLKEADAAFCCSEPEQLEKTLRTLIEDESANVMVQKKARNLSLNHSAELTPIIIRDNMK